MKRQQKSRSKLPSQNDILIAIRKKCMDCCGNQIKFVRECRSKDCPLHPFRTVEEAEKTAIKP